MKISEEIEKAKEIKKNAIYIIETAKKIVETLESDIEEEKTFDELLSEENFNIGEIQKKNRTFNLNLFDNHYEYYMDLYYYFNYHISLFFESKSRTLIKFKSSPFATINFSLLTDLLLEIIEQDSEALLQDIIKFDITAIVELFAEKNERLIYSDSFLLMSVNELVEKYNKISLKKNDFIKKMDEYYKIKASKTLNKVKSNLYNFLNVGFLFCKQYFLNKDTKNMKSVDELDKHSKNCNSIKQLYTQFKGDIKLKTDFQQLKSFFLKNDIQNYFIEYSQYLSKNIFFNECEYQNILENYLLPLNILEIELNDENSRIIANMEYSEIDTRDDNNFGYTFYQKFLQKKKEISFASMKNYKNEIEYIIQRDDFLSEFCSILESEPVSSFLRAKRKYQDKNFEVTFIEDNKTPLHDEQCLREQYDQFIKDIKNNNYKLLKEIIRIKALAYKIPAATGPSMKIILNPILNFSEYAKNDESQRINILKSALIILLVHEIAHFLKYFPIGNKYLEITPKTPKNKENGICLINYLFGQEKITNINNDQANLINNIETWKNIKNLKVIFQTKVEKYVDSKRGELDLYFSGNQEDGGINNSIKRKTDYCYWP